MNLFQRFFQDNKDFLNNIEKLDFTRNLSLIRKLKKEKDEVNFLSLISEISFGLHFDNISQSLKHEPPLFDGKTPDWSLIINDQPIKAEVARLNPDEEVSKILNFSNIILNGVQEIKKPYAVHVNFEDDFNKRYEVDIDAFKAAVTEWMIIPLNVGESLLFDNNLRIEITYVGAELNEVVAGGFGGPVNFKPYRLLGDKGCIICKADKYKKTIEQEKVPYIICVHADYHSWIKPEDLYIGLYGNIEYSNYGTMQQNYVNGHYYKQDESKELTYSHVTGILLMQNDEITYFHNYNSTNPLSLSNQYLFLEHQYNSFLNSP